MVVIVAVLHSLEVSIAVIFTEPVAAQYGAQKMICLYYLLFKICNDVAVVASGKEVGASSLSLVAAESIVLSLHAATATRVEVIVAVEMEI